VKIIKNFSKIQYKKENQNKSDSNNTDKINKSQHQKMPSKDITKDKRGDNEKEEKDKKL